MGVVKFRQPVWFVRQPPPEAEVWDRWPQRRQSRTGDDALERRASRSDLGDSASQMAAPAICGRRPLSPRCLQPTGSQLAIRRSPLSAVSTGATAGGRVPAARQGAVLGTAACRVEGVTRGRLLTRSSSQHPKDHRTARRYSTPKLLMATRGNTHRSPESRRLPHTPALSGIGVSTR
jgi:hypothetical protein